jgi:hypothetical protein
LSVLGVERRWPGFGVYRSDFALAAIARAVPADVPASVRPLGTLDRRGRFL